MILGIRGVSDTSRPPPAMHVANCHYFRNAPQKNVRSVSELKKKERKERQNGMGKCLFYREEEGGGVDDCLWKKPEEEVRVRGDALTRDQVRSKRLASVLYHRDSAAQ
ncbi:hypothetical protein NPIL_99861 [Nephila pilipes]|uniref:Uncharacterized protein n=1 Tax=Nephila pilipes TaxID=299642 RepID=A0A8X6TMN8_NEPPI|nr:hypothetical protein NPIL_99861 [Nephila pilipes]